MYLDWKELVGCGIWALFPEYKFGFGKREGGLENYKINWFIDMLAE
jgi:hypothetical protein